MLPARPGDLRDTLQLLGSMQRSCRRMRADHGTIARHRFRGDAWYAGGYYVVVCVAPSRQMRALGPTRLGPLAIDLVAQAWPDLFGDKPANLSGEIVRFERHDDEGELDAAAEIAATGMIETMWRIPCEDAVPRLSLVDVLAPVARVEAATRTTARETLTGRRRRLDWHVNLTSWRSTSNGVVPWANLFVPAEGPLRRASAARAFHRSAGVAPEALSSRRRRASVESLLSVVAEDLLVQNGYFDFADAPWRAARMTRGHLRQSPPSGVEREAGV